MDTKQTRLSVLMLPWLAHGHISPFLELAKKLTNRDIFIYFCSTPINLNPIKKKLEENHSLSIQLVELHLPSFPDLPPHHHTTNGLPPHLMPTLKKAFNMAKPTLSTILNNLNPDFVIHDITVQWAQEVASLLNIPHIPFLTSSATMCSFFAHSAINPGLEYPYPALSLREFELTEVRRLLEVSATDTGKEEAVPTRPYVGPPMMLIKSLREIEGKYIDYLSVLIKKKVIPIGTLIQEPAEDEDNNTEMTIEWLNKKDPFSTVFVSFGSEYFLSKKEIEDIAYGLELSSVNFIWVIRFPVGDEETKAGEVLPEGFLERVRERGMIVEGWAPQMRILGHPSIGGFVSHCGWSSIIESMVTGVPIIAMPMQLDQPMNAKLVVEIGVGMEVLRDNDGRLQREEVGKVIREVVVEKSGEDVRRKAREFKEKMRFKGEKEIDGLVQEFRHYFSCGTYFGQSLTASYASSMN